MVQDVFEFAAVFCLCSVGLVVFGVCVWVYLSRVWRTEGTGHVLAFVFYPSVVARGSVPFGGGVSGPNPKS